jgi:hypothetical protein
MKATIKQVGDQQVMVIELPITTPTISTSGKTLNVGTTRGFAGTGCSVDGKEVRVSINAIVAK